MTMHSVIPMFVDNENNERKNVSKRSRIPGVKIMFLFLGNKSTDKI